MQVGLGREFGKLFVELDAAFFAYGVGVLLTDVGADFADCLAGFDPAFVEPVDGRMPFFGGNDFDALSVFERGGQRHDLPFDFRAAAAVTDAAVQGVGKVDGGRARRQGEDFAVRGQDVNRVVEKLGFEGGGEVFFAAFRHVFAPVQKLAQPSDFLFVGGIALAALFVTPVGGDTEFVELVHIEGADLHFHAFVFRADDDGVQTFIAVAFGVGDVVVELARDGLPEAVDDTQRGVTLGNGINQNPHGADVKQPVEAEFFLHHFFVNGVDVFRAAGYFEVNVVFFEFATQDVEEVFDVFEAFGAFFVQKQRDFAVFFGFLMAKAEVFELPLELPHAQTVGERGENVEGFFGDGALFGAVGNLAEELHGAGAHGEFDQHDADVSYHRQQHFTHGFGLLRALFGSGEAVHSGEVGEFLHFVHTFDQLGDGAVAAFGNQKVPIGNVASDVGKQGGGDGIGEQVEFVDHLRRAKQMVEQQLAIRRGGIGGIVFFCQRPCGADEVFIVVWQRGAVAVEPFAQFLRSRALRVLNRAGGGHDGVFSFR